MEIEESEALEKEALREKFIELTQMGSDSEITHTEIDQAIDKAVSLGLEGQERDWFVRSYLINLIENQDVDIEKILEDSQLRRLYEDTWKQFAFEKYGVKIDEQRLQEVIEMTISDMKNSNLVQGTDIFYLAEKLGYSIEEFFSVFDRHIYESWVIAESLFPILQDQYKLHENNDISNQYRLEVIDHIVESQF